METTEIYEFVGEARLPAPEDMKAAIIEIRKGQANLGRTNPAASAETLAAIDEIIALNGPALPPPGSFTLKEYTLRLEETRGITLSRPAIRDRLNALVVKGILDSRMALVNRRETRVWWAVEKPDKPD